jgi:hypothetical protein
MMLKQISFQNALLPFMESKKGKNPIKGISADPEMVKTLLNVGRSVLTAS